MIRIVTFGTTVEATRVMHAAMTKMPDASSKNTPIRRCSDILRVHKIGSGMVSKSASVAALKQLRIMKKVDDAVHVLSGSGRT
jgi:hypothetical protein